MCTLPLTDPGTVPAGLPSCGGNGAVDIFDINQPSLPTPVYSVLVSVSVFMALSTVFDSIKSPDNSTFSLFFQSYFCLIGPFNYTSLMKVSFSPDLILSG